MYGPFQDPAQAHLAPRLVHAAVNGKSADLKNVFRGNADEAIAPCYIKDTARAIALLQTAEKLEFDVYNIGSDRITPNREFVEAITRVVPNFKGPSFRTESISIVTSNGDQAITGGHRLHTQVRHPVGHQRLCRLAQGWKPEVDQNLPSVR